MDAAKENTDIKNEDLSADDLLAAVTSAVTRLSNLNVNVEWNANQGTKVGDSGPEYEAIRKDRITSRHCHKIFALKDSTPNTTTLNEFFNHENDVAKRVKQKSLEEFEENKPKILNLYKTKNQRVSQGRFFIDEENGIFGSTPHALVGKDGLLKLHMPKVTKGTSPTDAVKREVASVVDGKLKMNVNGQKYREIVMQLSVTGRAWCDFVTYANEEIVLVRVNNDAEVKKLWEEMKKKLDKFFKEDIAPEMVSPKWPSAYRQPKYRQEKKNEADEKKEKKRKATEASSEEKVESEKKVKKEKM